MTDSTLSAPELFDIEGLIDRHGINQVLIALSEIAGLKGDHIETNWQDVPLAKRWFTLEGALACAVTKATGL